MNFLNVIKKCKNNNIKLAVDNGKILLKGDKEKITKEIIDELKIYKEEIIFWLNNNEHLPSHYSEIHAVARHQEIPLSYAQQRLWFIDKLDGESARFNMQRAMRIRGTFNVAAAEQAIIRIIGRHEPLRTTFAEQNGVPIQVIQEDYNFKLHCYDLLNLNEQQQNISVEEIVRKDDLKSFNLASDLMLRASYIQLSEVDNSKEGVLLFNMHHIASDGWSMGILVNEFIQQYLAIINGEGDPLPPLAIQYADYAHWQRQWLTDDALSSQLFYWKQQLADAPVVHSLPLDYPRPESKNHRGGVIRDYITSEISSRLQHVAKTQQVTPFMLLHAALALVLSRHSNSHDIVIGTPTANRMQTELEPLIGFFVNTLVLRTNTNFENFTDYLNHVKQVNEDAQANQDIPFEHVIDHCQTPRSMQYTPLFQFMFSMNTNEQGELNVPGLQFSPLIYEGEDVANFDIEIRAEVTEDGIAIWWVYDKTIFSSQHITHLSRHLHYLLNNIAENPKTSLRNLPMMHEEEIHHLVCELNNTEVAYPGNNRIHQLFEAQVERYPDHVAVVFENQRLTYIELNKKANQIAHYLIEQGIENNHLVGIYAMRSPDFLVAILAIMKAGGAYVPLDPNNPPDRLRYMVENAQASVVLTQSALSGTLYLPETCQSANLDNNILFNHYPTSNLDIQGCENDYAYMIYTSGSTGRPKGALVHHAGAINHIYAEFDLLGFMDNGELLPHNFLQSAASSSDVSVWQFLAPIVSGGKTVILDDMTQVEKLVNLLNNEQVHLIQTAPVVLQLMVDYLSKRGQLYGDAARVLTHLRWLMIIAEPCPIPLINHWFALYPSIPVMNGFGPTEASDDITYYIMRAQLGTDLTSIPIGKAIPNMNMYVLDSQQQLVPWGAIGELCVSGVGVGPGYWQNPERNAQSFVPNPYKNYPGNHGDRLYRTGDLGRWLPNGELEFIGRIDHQVKIRGFRIELGEIEHQLSTCEGMAASTILVREDEPGDKRLVAYVVPTKLENLSESVWIDTIRTSLEANLPSHMLPSAYVVLSELPLTPADKIDKKALPAPGFNSLKPMYVPPITEAEHVLVSIWAKLLKLNPEAISITDNFFHLGGHSILAVRLIAYIRDHFDKELSVKVIFQTPYIRGLAEQLSTSSAGALRTLITSVSDEITILPLSFAQQRLWFIDRMDGGSAQYNMPRALRVEGMFNVEAAEVAIERIIWRHESLRTIFTEHDDGPIQVIQKAFNFILPVHDLRSLPLDQQDSKVIDLVKNDRLSTFNLSTDLMVRASYILLSEKNGTQKGVLLFNMHHIASDGWSLGLLINEFIQQYKAVSSGQADPLAALSIQYSDYAYWQRKWLTGSVLENQLSYWKNHLINAPIVHSLPLDYARPEVKSYEGGVVLGHVSTAVSEQLINLAKAEQVTFFMLLHAALALVLSRHSNSQDIMLGTPVANRMQTELEPLIGFFVNTLVLRARTDFENFADYLNHIKQINLDAQANQDIPFEYLVDQCQVPRSMQHTPLFQIIFIMDTTEQSNLNLPGLHFSLIEGNEGNAKFDLNITAGVTDEGLVLSWVYDKSIFSHKHIEQLNQHLQQLLYSIVATPKAALCDLQMLSEKEVHHLLYELNASEYQYPTEKLIHEEFEWQAELYPDNIAVIFGQIKLSYRELNEISNRLAHYLREQGVVTGTLVGIRLKRSVEMIAGILGVLKAGGCYVPFDPDHPKARLSYVLEDTGLKHFLTQKDLSENLELGTEVKIINLDVLFSSQNLQRYSNANLGRLLTQNTSNLAYIIYTSGSTGQPKGVMVNHLTISNFLHFAVRIFMPEHVEGAVVSSTLAFDATVGSLYPPLYCGRYIELLQDDESVLEGLENCLLQGNRSLLFKITPAHLDAIASKGYLNKNPYSKHVLVIAGEQLLIRNLHAWKYELLPASNFINEYGPTETTVGSTTFHGVDDLDIRLDSSRAVPIGRPLDNAQLYILDEHQNLSPKGVIGELYIGGAGVSVGYINRPELTAEKFIYKAFVNSTPQRLYRTGDLVRYLNDGNVEFIGRIDHQVKIRGFRIELGEIEYQLKMHPGVITSVVMAREDEPGKKRLVAYVVPESKELSGYSLVEQLRAKLQENLPIYMVPSAIVIIDELPLNINGKVDKGALPAPEGMLQQGNYVAPETNTEKALVNIWAKLLKLAPEELSTTSNFFALGGDSILSIQLVSRSAKADIYFSVKDLFNTQTIKRLAEVVQFSAKVIAPQDQVVGENLLLPIQQKFFTNEIDLHHYNQSAILVTPTDFNEQILTNIVRKLYTQHDALRLKFVRSESGWSAVYVPLQENVVANAVTIKDWHENSFDLLEDYATSIQKTLRPEEGELFKAVYIRPTNTHVLSGRLLLVIHHLVVDGVSWRVLLENIEALYEQWKLGSTLSLPAKTSSYQQWGQWLSLYAENETVLQERNYWLNAFSTPVTRLTELAARSSIDIDSLKPGIDSVRFNLNEAVTKKLLSMSSHAYRTNINELLLAGLLLGFYKWSGERVIQIDLEGHGREHLTDSLDISETVGWFTSVFPLTLCFDDNAALSDIICAVKEQYRAIPKNGIGFGILKYLRQDISFKNLPASELVFNYLGQFDQTENREASFSLASESSGQSISTLRKLSHPLSLNGIVIDGCLSFNLLFDASKYTTIAMQKFVNSIAQAIDDIAEHCVSVEHSRYTPSDFPLAKADQQDIYKWQLNEDIEDLYFATGMQQGLLFHSMLDAGNYVTQTLVQFKSLNLDFFIKAWHQVVQRHAILRTAFVGIDTDNIHQLVKSTVSTPCFLEDLSNLSTIDQEKKIESIRLSDKNRGFDPLQAPLMRITILNLGGNVHQLIWSHHHALLDGWCKPLVFGEVTECYRALIAGELPQLREVSHYRNYIIWLSQQDMKNGRKFWQKQLADVEYKTPLPLVTFQKNEVDTEIFDHLIAFTDDETEHVLRLARVTHTTTNVIIQAAWALLLANYSGQEKVIFGATTSGRPAGLAGVEYMVGLFINTLPAVIDINKELNVTQWLQKLHGQVVEREIYSYLSLRDIQSLAPANQGLFDSLLIFENYPVDEAIAERITNASLDLQDVNSYEETNYGMSLYVNLGRSLSISMEYQSSLFTLEAIQQIAKHFKQLILNLSKSAHSTVCDVEMLAANEVHQLLATWNNTYTEYQKEKCVHELFEAQAKDHPNAIAIIFNDQQLTYNELNTKSNQLANYLITEKQVKPDTLIGICIDRSLDMVIAMLGVLKAGGAYVPLDPDYPNARLSYMLEDAKLQIVLTQQNLFTSKPISEHQALCLDNAIVQQQLALQPKSNIEFQSSSITSNNLAYVIYTSGSTGNPKGVMVEHRNVVNFLLAMKDKPGMVETDSLLAVTSTSFDIHGLEIFLPIIVGAKLVLTSKAESGNPELLLKLINRYKISIMQATPSTWKMLIEAKWQPQHPLKALCGGEALGTNLAQSIMNLKIIELWNMYGPTETTIWSTIKKILPDDDQVLMGKPISNTQIYITSNKSTLVPVGVAGELLIGGDGVSRGYLNRPDLTEEKFISNRFHDDKNNRLYRTGDLARWLPDGNLEFLGRIDYQVKIRGFRIELGEIESAILELSEINSAVVLADTHESSESKLIAYITTQDIFGFNLTDLSDVELIVKIREALTSKLPDYMMPHHIVVLDKLPLTPNGKVDRKMLLGKKYEHIASTYIAPQTEIECKVAYIWSNILNVELEKISVTDSFFELGGDSFSAVKMISEVNEYFSIKISLTSIFKKKNLKDFSNIVAKSVASE